MRHALVVRHVPYEDAAGFVPPIECAGYRMTAVDVLDQSFDGIDYCEPDLLVLMGGPMGVYERAGHPWIGGEVSRIAARLETELPTLAVCLGAQLVAAALGARVYKGSGVELGFAPLSLTSDGCASPVRHLADTPLLHWHGDTFDLPDGCDLLASSTRYPNQIFRRGQYLLAVQCHPEMGEDPRILHWIDGGEDDLLQAGLSAEALLSDYASMGPRAVRAGQAMVGEWLTGLR